MANRVQPSQAFFNKIFQNVEDFPPSQLAQEELKVIKSQLGRNLTNAEFATTRIFQENKNWIVDKLADGYNVIDIGPKIPNQIKSPSYGMERSFVYPRQ